MSVIIRHDQLIVFQRAVDAAMKVFEICLSLPPSERYELKSQWVRASRSVAANIAETWRKRFYRSHFLSKLTDIDAEAAECQVWDLISLRCGYISEATYHDLYNRYDEILRLAASMRKESKAWTLKNT